MPGRPRLLHLLVLMFAAWIVLDFGLTVEGAFHFDTDRSLVWSRNTVVPTPVVHSLPLAACEKVPETATERLMSWLAPALHVPPPRRLPRSRFLAVQDSGGASDDH